MKKLLLGLFMTAILSNSFGQNFQVPERTLEQKHNRMVYFANIGMIVGISAAKESGMTIKEYGEYVGDQYKVSWNKEGGFLRYAKGTLANHESTRRVQDLPIKIVEQSEDKLVFDCKNNYKGIFNDGPKYGVTYEEFSLCWSIVNNQIAEYLGATYKQKELDNDLLRITISKTK